jgi:hypothetical protein
MPTFLSPIFDQFKDAYKIEKKVMRNDRDAALDLYLYFSAFMDDLILKNKNQKTQYTKLKKLGQQYIKSNTKEVVKFIK